MGVTRKVLNWYARMSPGRGKTSPPYEHVAQIGDPTLRKVCEPIPIEKVKSEEVGRVIGKLKLVLDKYGSVGMSAPQVGVNWRLFVMRHTAVEIAAVPAEVAKVKGMTPVPFTVFINPKLKVIDYQKIIHMEGCESVQGYSAEVPRFREVEITGYNEEGNCRSQVFKLWPARIAQHEMDHLDGKLFTDIMERKTLICTCWEEVNLSKGKVVIPFHPE